MISSFFLILGCTVIPTRCSFPFTYDGKNHSECVKVVVSKDGDDNETNQNEPPPEYGDEYPNDEGKGRMCDTSELEGGSFGICNPVCSSGKKNFTLYLLSKAASE